MPQDKNNVLYLMDNKSGCNNKPSSAFSLRKTRKDKLYQRQCPLPIDSGGGYSGGAFTTGDAVRHSG
jgi:hypothetical protein